MALRISTLAVDCHDPDALGAFWNRVLGGELYTDDDGDVVLAAPDLGLTIAFFADPEDKVVKNRWHLDLTPDDQDAEVTRVIGLGAVRVDIGQGDPSWVVLADPEGNEFCILSGR
jgi:catechol 2,3-dioxygenase-like lactoylglutathione lyase family enzyme